MNEDDKLQIIPLRTYTMNTTFHASKLISTENCAGKFEPQKYIIILRKELK